MNAKIPLAAMLFLALALSGCFEIPPEVICNNDQTRNIWAEGQPSISILEGENSLGTITITNLSKERLKDIECTGSGLFASEVPYCPESIGAYEQAILNPQRNPAYSSQETYTDNQGRQQPLLEGNMEIAFTKVRVRYSDTFSCQYR